MKLSYSFVHNVFTTCLSLAAMIMTIVYVNKLNSEAIPGAPRAFDKLKDFYLAECVRLSALIFVFDALVIIYHSPLLPFLKFHLGISTEAATFEDSAFGNLVLVTVLQFFTKVFACALLCFFDIMTLGELSFIIDEYVWTDEQVDKTEGLKKYKTLVTVVLVFNLLIIFLWFVYSGYQCYLARASEEEKPSTNYNPVASVD
eukprot:TRINITY_DN5135_c0_g1_i5.p1 TRINITY_DN5135_c0_g1~~TRINITY_DN5135_c0_g1_i5.p1  ORF type:complete len:201 (+),score=44.26 TRINITY_DN5135_c0_g1_i5:169-771(+)